MRTTVRELRAMGREAFKDAMMAELEAKAQRPNLAPEEREHLLAHIEETKAKMAARRARQEMAARKAA